VLFAEFLVSVVGAEKLHEWRDNLHVEVVLAPPSFEDDLVEHLKLV